MGDCNCKRMAAMDDSATGVSKRRKFRASSSPHKQRFSHSEAPLPPSPPMLHLRHSHSPQLLNSSDSCSSFCSDHSPPSSCCSSNELNDVVVAHGSPLLDLEAKSFETVHSNSPSANNKFSRETTPSSELCLGSEEMESPAPAVYLRRRQLPVSKAPPSDEIEEFFAMAEKYEQKRFAEKYNYDIVKDVPLEGRYQWVRLKP
ncbi:cyclin-dependent kinase inhibitor 7-like isoform X1 [Prunus avium]|uniref:Cyclin-dependent kinase inhibitor n=1 Tax=Prunus avium TaxID=42229 RepID=A0A6P5U0N5_PRUAV|nr:cyclin-dependent kinase inhibitor 7-like isoform X1 [Prunus avium]